MFSFKAKKFFKHYFFSIVFVHRALTIFIMPAVITEKSCHVSNQALKYRSVTDIVRPIREIVRCGEETVGHSVRPKWN